MTSPIVSPDWLEAHLGDPAVRVLEIANVTEPTAYCDGHVPGAAWLYWKSACWHGTDREFVSPAVMAALFSGLGIGPDTTVVLYGEPVQYGTYAYWAFTMAGHKTIKLLDGGRKKWLAEKRPLSRTIPGFAPVPYPVPSPDVAMRIGRDEVRAHLKHAHRLLLDVRSPEEYAGKRVAEYAMAFDHGAERCGRIPGARHFNFREVLNDDDSFKTPAEIRKALATYAIAPDDFQDVVLYCRLSHRATLVWVALAGILGFQNIKIYDGSWTEWGSIVGFPVER